MRVVDGSEVKPSNPPTKPNGDPDYDVIERYERRLQDFEDKVAKWEYKNLKACGRIKLACADGTLVEVKDMYSAKEVWEKLKKFSLPDKFLLRAAQKQLSRASQSEHKSVYEYGAYIKKAAQDCVNAGKKVEDWALRNFFTQGLNADLEAYIIPREQIAEEKQ